MIFMHALYRIIIISNTEFIRVCVFFSIIPYDLHFTWSILDVRSWQSIVFVLNQRLFMELILC